MREWYVVVCNVVEEVDFFLFEEKPSTNRMDGRISPTFVEETTVFIEAVEVVGVGLRSKPVEIANFKVGPLCNICQPEISANYK